MKKKVISAALAGTLAVSLLSACGASNEPQNISDVSSAASSEATSTTASSESTGDAAQELTFVLSNIPDGLDPSVTNNSFAQYVLINCFEGLVTYDTTPRHPDGTPRHPDTPIDPGHDDDTKTDRKSVV